MISRHRFNSRTFTSTFILIVLLTVVGIGFFTYYTNAQSGSFTSPVALTGYLWSGTQNASDGGRQGMGWISLNCSNDDSCTASDYKVQINPTNKTLSGYAWIGGSANIPGGFIQFGNGLSGCPGSGSCAARIIGDDVSGYKFSGWARALAHSDPNAGGWDGWISLNCLNHGGCAASSYAVTISNNGTFPSSSFAWGSDVLGRVSFGLAQFTPPCLTTNACTADNTGVTTQNLWCETKTVACTAGQLCSGTTGSCVTPTVVLGNLVLSAALVRAGATIDVSWTATEGVSCQVRRGTSEVLTNNPSTTAPITAQTTFVLYCVNDTNTETEVDRETVRVVPVVFDT